MRGEPASAAPGWLAGWAPALVLLAIAALAQLPFFDRSAVAVDEGQLVAIADRILNGEVLYRDVYTGLFPGIYYFTAALLGLFGEDLLVTRWAQLAINAATALCLWAIGLRAVSAPERRPWAAWAPAVYLALVVFGFPGLTMLNYSPLALLFALAALWALLRSLESGRLLDACVSGLCLGACGLVKQNFGGLAVVAVLAGAALGRRGGALEGRGLGATWGPILASGAALGALGLLSFGAAGAFDDLVGATLLTIGESQMDAFDDPIPPIFGAHPADDPRFVFVYTPASLFNYLVRGETLFGVAISPAVRGAAIRLVYGGALAVLLGALALLVHEWRRQDAPARSTRAVLVFAGLLFLGIFPSAIWSHLAFVAAPLLLAAGILGERAQAALARRSRGAGRAVAGLAAAFALAFAVVAVQIASDLRRWYPAPLGLPRADLRVSAEQRHLLVSATRYLERCARPEEPVFVAPDMPLLYFLADRPNPTPYDLVIPGDVRGDVIVDRLEATRTRCVVYNPRMYLQFAPFSELFPEVHGLLVSRYRVVERFAGEGAEWSGLIRRAPGS